MAEQADSVCSNAPEYHVVSSGGDRISISPELFRALQRARNEKIDGSIHVGLRLGGIAGVELQWKIK